MKINVKHSNIFEMHIQDVFQSRKCCLCRNIDLCKELPEVIEGAMAQVLQSNYWQPVSVHFNPQYLILDF